MSLWVLQPGLCTLIVDRGRPRSRSLGVPVGGAADRSALAIGNAMLANPEDAAGLEITLVGPSLVARARVGCVLVGAPFELHSSRQTLVPNKSFTLEPEEELHIGGTPCGVRAYLCVVGGFQTPVILGSRSSLAPVQRGAELTCAASAVPARLVRPEWPWHLVPALSADLSFGRHELRVVGGPQAEWFLAAPTGRACVAAWGEFTVRAASNRMGLRLQGKLLPVPAREMVSEPVCPG
jgi:allophanate hydrolase subunit 2